jgi:hypothetical protein
MTQHRCAHENFFDWFHEFFCLRNHDELDFKLVFIVFFQQRKKLNADFKKCMNETFIKICKVDENLYIFMRFRFWSIFDDDNFACLSRYFIEAHSKIKKIHMKNMKSAFVELEIKIKFFQALQHQFNMLNVLFCWREKHQKIVYIHQNEQI